MNDSITPDNTPIFDQLKAERGYDPKFTAEEVAPPFSSFAVTEEALEKASLKAARPSIVESIDSWISVPVPKITPVPVRTIDIVDPEECEEKYGCFSNYLHHRLLDFYEKFPKAGDATTEVAHNHDLGTVEVTVSAMTPGIRSVAGEEALKHPEKMQEARENYEANQKLIDGMGWIPESRLEKPFAPSEFEKGVLEYFNADKLTPKVRDIVKRKTGGVRLARKAAVEEAATEAADWGNLAVDFLNEATEGFRADHPEAIITAVEPQGNPDGTMSLVISAVEPKKREEAEQDQDASPTSVPKPLWTFGSEGATNEE